MASSPSLNNSDISALAEKIADARKLYGADSAYVIGIFAGLDWVLDSADTDKVKRLLSERVSGVESGKTSSPKPSTDRSDTKDPETSILEENNWIKGSVKWFNNDKGYGFISTDSATDVFVHWRDISSWDRSLGQGDEVEFMVTKTAKGFQAINVMKSEKDGSSGQSAEPATDEAEQSAEGHVEAAPSTAPPNPNVAATAGEEQVEAEADQPLETDEPQPAETAPADREAGGEPAAAEGDGATAGGGTEAESASPIQVSQDQPAGDGSGAIADESDGASNGQGD